MTERFSDSSSELPLFNRNLQKARRLAGYRSAAEFAEKNGFNAGTYTAHEQGQRAMSLEQAWRYSVTLGCSMDDLADTNTSGTTLTFGETIKLALRMKGLTASQLSEKSGVQQSYLSRVINGKILDPTWSKARAIIDALDMTIEEFRDLQQP
ncbi:helix-turn-helix transcriptional regulator [uncultured Senegalimassilia sp.]|uniref:helix-turn-helix domain-containing protein n=1 Tax=uncultured Senegalimassilia sp. TaxID=1714350 RepID=UPI00261258BF|nr:helix-turn-helix transcriptional regulator [uncultured Senegalimassilia sp.]